jgi:Spy/CpxP family protein refolding chaperone
MRYTRLFFIILFALAGTSTALYAQEGPPPGEGPHDERGDDRPNLLAALGLSPEQVQQIRRINQERRPAMMLAQRRMREANRALDMAIYRDAAVNDEEFQTRLKEVQAAQSDLARLRFETELSVRRILTQDQLVRFRDLRRQFAEEREKNMRERRQERMGDGPGMHGDRPDGHDGPGDRPRGHDAPPDRPPVKNPS